MNKVVPTDKEFVFEGKVSISQTDLDGNITFVNRKFCEISGYKLVELINSNHNIVRHPDMPKLLFSKMWKSLQSGQVWNGIIKNLHKNGQYYWIDTEILPIRDHQEKIVGYISVSKPVPRKNITDIKELYKQQDKAK